MLRWDQVLVELKGTATAGNKSLPAWSRLHLHDSRRTKKCWVLVDYLEFSDML
jgi:hypothetical protein